MFQLSAPMKHKNLSLDEKISVLEHPSHDFRKTAERFNVHKTATATTL